MDVLNVKSIPVVVGADVEDESEASRSSFGNTPQIRETIESENLYNDAKMLVEYEWPENSGQFYFIEEYLANYLEVRNLRRAYPTLNRRQIIDMIERCYLLESGMVKELQCDLGVIAIPSQQVWEIVAQAPEHKAKFEAYRHMMEVRKYEAMVTTMKKKSLTLNTPDSYQVPLEELKANALKACAKWNAGLQNQLPKKRSATRVHLSSMGPPSKMGYFPVAVLKGQYVDCPPRFSSEQLKKYPLNTVLIEPEKSVRKHISRKKKDFLKKERKPQTYVDVSSLDEAIVFCSKIQPITLPSTFPEDGSSRDGDDESTDSNDSSLFERVLIRTK